MEENILIEDQERQMSKSEENAVTEGVERGGQSEKHLAGSFKVSSLL